MLQATTERSLLHDMCDVIVRSGYCRAGVGYAISDRSKTIRWASVAGGDFALDGRLVHTWADTELGQTAIGTAIRTGSTVVRRNVHNDPAYDGKELRGLRKEAVELGYSAIAAFPMHLDGSILGALVIAAADGSAFDQEEVALLDELAKTLAFGVARLRYQEERGIAQALVEKLVSWDKLTGLRSRAGLLPVLNVATESSKRRSESLALLHCEVSRFREFSKVLGHSAADEVIAKVHKRLLLGVRPGEILARVGEAEFALMIPVCDISLALARANGLYDLMTPPLKVRGFLLDARIAVGIATFPEHGRDGPALLRRADAATQKAPAVSGGCAVYSGDQEKENKSRLQILGDFHKAIERNQLRLFCQPKVEFSSRDICGVEVLVRWDNASGVQITTQELVALVEEAGMIRHLTNWVLNAAFRQCRAWCDVGLIQRIAINLSVHDLYDRGFIDKLRDLFNTYSVPPALIEFELTEGALMADPVAANATLVEMKRLGVSIFIDDYGTGYSSLSYLQQLPVDGIKIDRSFISSMAANPRTDLIVSSTIELGHSLGMKVVAEGVEDQTTWERLKALGCDVAQGYLISKPMATDKFCAWASRWS